MRTVLNLIQGTPEWLKARAECDGTASEAPAMKGNSKYQTREALLEQRKTGVAKEVNAAMQAIFARGHETEANARPIAEEIIGDELSPTTLQLVIDGLTLISSLDGITFDDSVIYEHKLWNEELAEQVRTGNLEAHYTDQMDQELLVSGAKKCLFVVSDGTKDKCVWMWYESNQEKFDAIIAGWKQFKKDLETFILPEREEVIVAKVIEPFPMVTMQVRGELVSCNLDQLTPRFDSFLANTKTTLENDQDFADAKEAAKTSRATAKAIAVTRRSVTDQIMPVSEVLTKLEAYEKKFDALGLQLEKAVKTEEARIKADEMLKARNRVLDHISAANTELKLSKVQFTLPDFAGAIKGVRSIASLRSRLNNCVAASKIEIDAIARDLREKESLFESRFKDHVFLFADLSVIIHHPIEHFKLTCESRVASYKPVIEPVKQPSEVKPSVTTQEVVAKSATVSTKVAVESPSDEDLIQAVAACFHVGFEQAADWMMKINYKAALEQAKMPF